MSPNQLLGTLQCAADTFNTHVWLRCSCAQFVKAVLGRVFGVRLPPTMRAQLPVQPERIPVGRELAVELLYGDPLLLLDSPQPVVDWLIGRADQAWAPALS